jgi:hypothetical protein
MSSDIFGNPFRANCSCQGGKPADPRYEVTVCGGGTNAVCSDGDPYRARGGYGWAIGTETNLGPVVGIFYPGLGPSVNGTAAPTTSPRYALESPPIAIDPQRDPGTLTGSTTITHNGTGPIHHARTTDVREHTVFDPNLQVQKLRGFGDSFWSDWQFQSALGSYVEPLPVNQALVACDPPNGWDPSAKVDGVHYCSQLSRDSLTFIWQRDLTPAEQVAPCPPSCLKDFDLTTVETEALYQAALADQNAALQLGLQSGEGRRAGAGDAIGVTSLSLVAGTSLSDKRCRLGG